MHHTKYDDKLLLLLCLRKLQCGQCQQQGAHRNHHKHAQGASANAAVGEGGFCLADGNSDAVVCKEDNGVVVLVREWEEEEEERQ